jgi:hypothetical protein
MVEHLLCKREALSSNPSTGKKKKYFNGRQQKFKYSHIRPGKEDPSNVSFPPHHLSPSASSPSQTWLLSFNSNAANFLEYRPRKRQFYRYKCFIDNIV